MPVISSRISGWRVTDSMTLPKMMPMPTPAPTAPRPPPTPSAIALPASDPSSAAPKTKDRMVASTGDSSGLVVLGDRAAEVDGRQGGEDEGLQRGDQADLEEVEDHPERQGEPADRLEAQQHRQAAGHEEDDQVAGEDVGEETNGQRDEPYEVRHEFKDE